MTPEHLPACARRYYDLDQGRRDALVYRPGRLGGGVHPAVFAFHGAGSSAVEMLEFSQLCVAADRWGFVAVFPNGTGRVPHVRSWNTGAINVYAVRHRIDDVGFVQMLVQDLVTTQGVDPRRVYCAGMSNGGLLAHLLGAKLPDLFAAVAAVGCSLIEGQQLAAQAPMPVLHFHGTADKFVPFHGGVGEGGFTKSRFVPVRELIDAWVDRNECRRPPRIASVSAANSALDHETRVEVEVYGAGPPGAEVRFVIIHEGGHTWPGQPCRHPFLGRSTRVIDANDLIWDFFRGYPKAHV